MGTKKMLVKGLAAGAVLGAVAALIHAMEDKDKKAMAKKAMDIKDKVVKHAKTLGALSKDAYGKIVDTTVNEYRGMKALSEDELKEMARDLKGSWKDVAAMMKAQAPKMAKKVKTEVKKTIKKKRA
jgi:gas vesicle protein